MRVSLCYSSVLIFNCSYCISARVCKETLYILNPSLRYFVLFKQNVPIAVQYSCTVCFPTSSNDLLYLLLRVSPLLGLFQIFNFSALCVHPFFFSLCMLFLIALSFSLCLPDFRCIFCLSVIILRMSSLIHVCFFLFSSEAFHWLPLISDMHFTSIPCFLSMSSLIPDCCSPSSISFIKALCLLCNLMTNSCLTAGVFQAVKIIAFTFLSIFLNVMFP